MKRTWIQGWLLIGAAMYASAAGAEAGWTDYGTVLELTPSIHERFNVTLDISKNPSDCRSKRTFYQVYSFTGANRMYDLLLEALVHGREVRVFVTGNCDIDDYSEISAATIVP